MEALQPSWRLDKEKHLKAAAETPQLLELTVPNPTEGLLQKGEKVRRAEP